MVDYVVADPQVKITGKSKAEVAAGLTSVGFDEEMMAKPITGISGGWKMKLALTRWVLGSGRGWRLGRPDKAVLAHV